MTYPTTGHTYSISKQEADQNYHATLLAMVEEHPDNQYWRNLLDAHLSEIEIQHDAQWLGVDDGTTASPYICGGEIVYPDDNASMEMIF